MTTKDILELVLGSGGLLGILFLVFRMGKLAQKVETTETNIEEIKHCLHEIGKSISRLEVQIGKLEARSAERTLRVVSSEYERNGVLR